MRAYLRLATLVSFVILAFLCSAYSAETTERLRVGLVLSGGGARGAAHVGVLKVLQELRVPVDAIAGTSMGAVVGGLYAAGMEPDELDALVRDIDWDDAFSDRTARNTLSFRRRQDDTGYLVKFDLGYNNGNFVLPKGIIQGQKLGLILREQTLEVSHIDRFDNLPTPFRAVAADLTNGASVELKEGDLVTAMRASMAAPGVFSPIEVDGRPLVDGGLVKNIPIDVGRAMDVDVIIAVDVGFPLRPADDLNSAVAVADQMLTILIRREADEQIGSLSPSDILLAPRLENYSSANFADVASVIPLGETVARDAADKLRTLAVSEDNYSALVAARQRKRSTPPVPRFVTVDGDVPIIDRAITSRLGYQAGEAFDPGQIAADAGRIYGLELFESVDYSLVEIDGEFGLEYRTVAKSWGPNYLQFGLSFEEEFEGTSEFNVGARYTRTAVNRLGAEWRTDLQIGTSPLVASEFYQPLSFDLRYFVAPEVSFQLSSVDVFDSADRVARFRLSESAARISLGREIGNSGEVRVGIQRSRGNARRRVGDPALINADVNRGGYFLRLARDTLDDPQFPRAGSRFDLTWELERRSVGSDTRANLLSAEWNKFRSWGRHTLGTGIILQTTESGAPTFADFFELGGFLNLSGLDRGQLRGPHAALARFIYFRRLGEAENGLLDWPIYMGASLEAGRTWESRDAVSLESMTTNASLFVGLDTLFGPLFLAAGFSEAGDSSIYLFLGSPVR